jgi:hypothetical protein
MWAVEGGNGIGRHIAQRLVADGETVVDVPAKLSAFDRDPMTWLEWSHATRPLQP